MIFVLLAIFMPVSKCLPKMCIKNVLFAHILLKLLKSKKIIINFVYRFHNIVYNLLCCSALLLVLRL